MSYRLIVGLGNPGSEYAYTRHNVGFRIVDAFASRHGPVEWKTERRLKGELAMLTKPAFGKLRLLKPTTFMNESGLCVQKTSSFYKVPPEEMVIIYDEINLPLGELKISVRGSSGGHNGLEDVINRVAPRFTRLRIGIGQKPITEMDLADYVLGKFTSDEETTLAASMDRFVDSLEQLLRLGPEKAMNQINRKQKDDDSNSI